MEPPRREGDAGAQDLAGALGDGVGKSRAEREPRQLREHSARQRDAGVHLAVGHRDCPRRQAVGSRVEREERVGAGGRAVAVELDPGVELPAAVAVSGGSGGSGRSDGSGGNGDQRRRLACAKYSRSGVEVHMPSTMARLASHEMLRNRPTMVSAPASVRSLGGARLAAL